MAATNIDATVTLIDHLMQIFEDLIIPALLAWFVVVIRNWSGKLNIESPHPNDHEANGGKAGGPRN